MSLEDRFRQSLTAVLDDVRAKLEAEFQSAMTDVRAEADEAKSAALAEARSSVESDLLLAFNTEKETIVSAHQSLLAQAHESALAEAQRLRDEAAAEVARVREDAESAAAALRDEAIAAAVKVREEADAAVAAARADAEKAASDLARQREELEAATSQQRDELEASAAKQREEHDAAMNADRADAQLVAHVRDAHAASAGRMLEAARGLDGASSLTEVLDALTGAVARESGRAAVLVVKGDRLIGWRTSGFGSLDAEPRSIEAGTSDVGVLAAAVHSARSAVTGHGSESAAPAFAQLTPEQVGIAVPLVVGGRAVAVVYADAGAQDPLPAWQATVEVLVRHAGRCLEAMTVQRAAQARSSSVRVGMPA